MALADTAQKPALRLERAATLALSADHAQAVAEADQLSRQPALTGEELYRLGRVFALAAVTAQKDTRRAADSRDDAARRAAQRAIDAFAASHAVGFLRSLDQWRRFQDDTQLRPFRAREEFAAFLRKLEGGKGEDR